MIRIGLVLMLLGAACGGGDSGSDAGKQSERDPFDEGALTTYEISLSTADWSDIVMHPLPGEAGDQYKHATVVWQGEVLEDVGVKVAGQHSRIPGNSKPSLHLDFEQFHPGRHFHHLPSLKLNGQIDDPALIRERLTYNLGRAFGLAAPREVHARLVVNGDYKGLYCAEERVTKSFVVKRFGPLFNQVYKFTGIDLDVNDVGMVPSRYVIRANTVANPVSMFEAHVDSLGVDDTGLMNLVLALNHDPAAASALFDTEVFLREMAVETVSGEEDAYLAGPDAQGNVWSNNFYFYKNPATGKTVFIPWDRNEGWWRLPADASITQAFDQHVLTRRIIMDQPQNLARFKVLLGELLNGPGSAEALQASLDRIVAQIQEVMKDEPFATRPSGHLPTSYAGWQAEAAELRNYIRLRNDGVRGQLP